MISNYDRNSKNDKAFSEMIVKEMTKKGKTLIKTSGNIDKIKGYDYLCKETNEKIDLKHCHGSYIMGTCKKKNSSGIHAININHPWRNSTESTHIYQGCFVMKKDNWLMHPISKLKMMTKLEYQLQYFKDEKAIQDCINELENYLFKEVTEYFVDTNEIFELACEIIPKYLNDTCGVLSNGNGIMLVNLDLHKKYIEKTGQKIEYKFFQLKDNENNELG